MGTKKGLVMAVNGNKATVLTPEGEFKEYQMTGIAIGDEVVLPVPTTRTPYWLSAAVLLIIVLAGMAGGVLFQPAGNVYAYISMDINPSVELAVSSRGTVTEVNPLNNDGARLVAAAEVKRLPVDNAVAVLLRKAREMGYLDTGDNTVVFSVNPIQGEAKERLKLASRLRNTAYNNLPKETTVSTVSVGSELREEAKSMGLSAGKYAILMEAREQGLEVSVENLKTSSIIKAIKEADGIPGQVINKAEKDVRFQKKQFKREFKDNVKKSKHNERQRADNSNNDEGGKGQEGPLPGKGEKHQPPSANSLREEGDDEGYSGRAGKSDPEWKENDNTEKTPDKTETKGKKTVNGSDDKSKFDNNSRKSKAKDDTDIEMLMKKWNFQDRIMKMRSRLLKKEVPLENSFKYSNKVEKDKRNGKDDTPKKRGND
ncbi:anti-sigma factor domain-containing protein [Metallumcola ferriviriculae]|uniref:Anti-sigma factor domain-containing protein n=1 Tax=Metallumcola ferriviriculae TaxID=3039180 RepID=A0AAU0UQZ6_9FIRM|nr:anti-sigma factor domain-containing protein [Desulfitibacteraceae bacterium MK1]